MSATTHPARDIDAITGPAEPVIEDVNRNVTDFRHQLGEITYELYDLIDNLVEYHDAEAEDVGHADAAPIRAILHKTREGYGPLIAALQAARQAQA